VPNLYKVSYKSPLKPIRSLVFDFDRDVVVQWLFSCKKVVSFYLIYRSLGGFGEGL